MSGGARLAIVSHRRARFNEDQNKVFPGANALSGKGVDANSRMSTLACLAHELAHAEWEVEGARIREHA